MTSGILKKYIFANLGVPSHGPMVPIVSFKETTGHGRVVFSFACHSLGRRQAQPFNLSDSKSCPLDSLVWNDQSIVDFLNASCELLLHRRTLQL